jgi:hypothetical protein
MLIISTCDSGINNNGTYNELEDKGGQENSQKKIIITNIFMVCDNIPVPTGTDAVVLISANNISFVALGGGQVADDHSLSILLETPVSKYPWKNSGEYFIEINIIIPDNNGIDDDNNGLTDDDEEDIVYGYKYTNGGNIANIEKYNLANEVSIIDFNKFCFFDKKHKYEFPNSP